MTWGLRRREIGTVAALPLPVGHASELLVTLLLAVVIAVLLVVWRRGRRLGAELGRLRALAQERGAQIEEVTRRLALVEVTDALTGLPNRHSILDRGAQELAYARRHRTPLAVALLDVDHLDEVNDALGHDVGDTLLRQVATALRTVLRAEDVLGRYGGDQLLALLPGTPMTGVLHAGERLRQAVEGVAIATGMPGAPTVGSSVSVGVTTVRPDDESLTAVLRRASEALARAKAAGCNRVEVL